MKQETQTYDYEMFTPAGNRAVHSLYKAVERKINGKVKVNENDVLEQVKKGLAKISEVYPEVHDTEPEQHLEYRINKVLKDNGYAFNVDRYRF